MTTVKEQMETKYAVPDPFEVQNSEKDLIRKNEILKACGAGQHIRALDIGCGEGWITTDLPADEIVGYDISETALSRCPDNVKTVSDSSQIEGKFDLIIAAGVLVDSYDYHEILDLIHKHACGIIITCQTDLTEVDVMKTVEWNQVHDHKFVCGPYAQQLRIFDFTEEGKQAPDLEISDKAVGDMGTLVHALASDEAGPDITFKEMIDKKIDEFPEGSNLNTLILNEDTHHQLIMGEDIADMEYRGLKLVISAGEPNYTFTIIEPDEDVS